MLKQKGKFGPMRKVTLIFGNAFWKLIQTFSTYNVSDYYCRFKLKFQIGEK